MKKIKMDRSKALKRLILVLLLLACITAFVAQKIVQRYGFEGIGDFISVYMHNSELADQVEPEEMQLLVSEIDYEFLKNRRDVALERGIQINDGEDTYVACKIVHNGDTVKGEMRLKGHMTDHLEGDKWSFRVKTKKKPVMEMTRFSLQAPGTRNYAYEWVYHQLLRQEGIIYLHYDFIRLKLNDKDLGIYAIEEHFGQHVLEHNNRPKGAILRWNPNLYWEQRIDEMQGTYLNEQYSHYSSSFIEPFESGVVEDDSELVATYQQGAAMLEAFRRGERTTSEVFDVLKMARFHAIIDLVGGQHSLDWSDVKFFYNSETGKIEPVGYESFSVRKTESIAGQRIPNEYDGPAFNYHNQLFSDPAFYAIYIQELERIADEAYFNAFMKLIRQDLDQKLGVLAHEFPYRKFTFDPYFENISLIRHNLELPKPFHAFKEIVTDSTVQISVTPVSDFPIEILALMVDGKDEFKLDTVFVLPAKARNTYAHYFNLVIRHDGVKLKNLRLKARIPGSSGIFEIVVDDLPSYRFSDDAFDVADKPSEDHVALVYLNDSVMAFNEREITISSVLSLKDTNETLVVFPGQHLHFTGQGRLVSRGHIEMIGGSEEGEEIVVSSEGVLAPENAGSAQTDVERIAVFTGTLTCVNVSFINANRMIWALESKLDFTQCTFADIDSSFLSVQRCGVDMDRCASGSLGSLGTFDRCLVRISDFTAINGETFLTAYGSDVDLVRSTISGYNTVATLRHASCLSAWSSSFSATTVIAGLDDASEFKTYGGSIQQAPLAFKIDYRTNLPGASAYTLYSTSSEGIGKVEDRKKI
jgi:hypothetical protein